MEPVETKLAEWKRLTDAATPGPWSINDRNEYGDLYVGTKDRDWFVFAHPLLPGEPHRANAEFIAAAREAVPALIAENARLREALEVLIPHLESAWPSGAAMARKVLDGKTDA